MSHKDWSRQQTWTILSSELNSGNTKQTEAKTYDRKTNAELNANTLVIIMIYEPTSAETENIQTSYIHGLTSQ